MVIQFLRDLRASVVKETFNGRQHVAPPRAGAGGTRDGDVDHGGTEGTESCGQPAVPRPSRRCGRGRVSMMMLPAARILACLHVAQVLYRRGVAMTARMPNQSAERMPSSAVTRVRYSVVGLRATRHRSPWRSTTSRLRVLAVQIFTAKARRRQIRCEHRTSNIERRTRRGPVCCWCLGTGAGRARQLRSMFGVRCWAFGVRFCPSDQDLPE